METARDYLEGLEVWARRWYGQFDVESILFGVFGLVAFTLIFYLLVKLLSRLSSRVCRVVEKTDLIRPVRFQQQEILSASDIRKLAVGCARGTYYLVVLALFYFCVSVVFVFFPPTRSLAGGLLTLVFSSAHRIAVAVVDYLPDLAFIIIAVLFSRYLIKVADLISSGVARGRITIHGFFPEWAKPTFNIFRFMVIVFTLVVIFPYFPGATSPAFQGVSIFFGVLLSLGSTGAVANVVAGVVITYTRAFQVGDRVRIAETEGDIVEKTLFVTRMRTPKNVVVAVPNSMVLSNHVVNFSAMANKTGLILNTRVSIGYDVPWKEVHRLLIAAAIATEGVDNQPEPFVLQKSLDDFYVTYELNAFTSSAGEMSRLYSRLHQNIQDQFNRAGVEIMSPHYSALRDGNTTALPSEDLPKGYRAPGFRIERTGENG